MEQRTRKMSCEIKDGMCKFQVSCQLCHRSPISVLHRLCLSYPGSDSYAMAQPVSLDTV